MRCVASWRASLPRYELGLQMTAASIFPWQTGDWQRLQRLRERLPHALLFYGGEGTGKFTFVERFAAALLCERPVVDGHACGTCGSCGWFSNYAHPDYRRVRPDALEGEDAGDDAEAEDSKSKKTAKTPSRDIRIEQVRALAGFMNVSTHRSGLRVVLLYPAEALNTASANALLKTLEEPPPATVFLLVTHRIDRLLPTIVSRCRQFALPMPDRAVATRWMAEQGISDAARWLAEHGGAPLAARDSAFGDAASERDELLAHLAKPTDRSALIVAERLQKVPLPTLIAWQQRWLYDLLTLKLAGRIRYFPHMQQSLLALVPQVGTEQLQQALRDANQRRSVAEHPLSARLFIEDMLLAYVRLFRN